MIIFVGHYRFIIFLQISTYTTEDIQINLNFVRLDLAVCDANQLDHCVTWTTT